MTIHVLGSGNLLPCVTATDMECPVKYYIERQATELG